MTTERSGRFSFHAALAPLLVIFLSPTLSGCEPRTPIDYAGPTADWPSYAGDMGAGHYSPLTQVNRDNVDRLEVAWRHNSGDYFDGSGETGVTTFQATPIVVNDMLYYCTPFQRVFALNPETGEEKWVFDPELRLRAGAGPYPLNCRGVTYWEDPERAKGTACQKRIFHGVRQSSPNQEKSRSCPDAQTR